MIDLIHVGDYKTGTSWFQEVLFLNHEEIYYLDSVNHPIMVNLMHQLVDARDIDFNPIEIRYKIKKYLKSLNTDGKKIVISRESLSGKFPNGDNVERIAKRLFQVFGKVKIFFMIREQFSAMKSFYSEYIKIGGTLKFDDFIYDPIISGGIFEKLNYDKTIDMYVSIFGKDNLFVGLYEEFSESNSDFLKRLYMFMGTRIPKQNFLKKSYQVNKSLHSLALIIQRLLNNFLRSEFNPKKNLIRIDIFLTFFLPSRIKNRIILATKNRLCFYQSKQHDKHILYYGINYYIILSISRFLTYFTLGPKLKINRKIIDDHKHIFIKSNSQLKKKYRLSVDKYNYFVDNKSNNND
jgi:hypothetical protein